jgi:hypothetical protein
MTGFMDTTKIYRSHANAKYHRTKTKNTAC